ncbi:unnamed protein product [Notodromas monacha]|uniref:39S ribosomal protein L2, mitochondrial n=1 Tax=Notodromas monacha TaxID=399045 RepID=A0A7R9BVY0_9CRUS|nr:unnamed protein product [Notodromas monacha]CAG0921641.1 unnamed protein product [Notodromas monacha]
MVLVELLGSLSRHSAFSLRKVLLETQTAATVCVQSRQKWETSAIDVPNPPGGKGGRYPQGKPAPSRQYWYNVHFPEDGKYTIDPLPVTKLAGRDPVTGRVVVGTRGGGFKFKFRWLDNKFPQPEPGKTGPVEEKVIYVKKDPTHTGFVALFARGNYLRYMVATEFMKAGDVIQTHWDIPKIPVRPKDGDAHPLGALPVGTQICNIEVYPGFGAYFCRAAGTSATIIKKVGDRVFVKMPNKKEYSFDERVMAYVGRISNPGHKDEHIGSPNRLRWLGYRPRSGLWHRKDGYCGRKIRPLPPVKAYNKKENESTDELIRFTVNLKGPRVRNYRGAWQI